MIKSLACLLACMALNAHAETSMTCGDNELKNIAKSTKIKRLNPHLLQIITKKNQLTFKDKPPYDDEFAGTKWQYCTYNPALKLHLIHKTEDSTFSGILVDELTGQQMQAGQEVLFSDDGQRFAAFEQPDGLDGRTLRIYQRNGVLLWQGYDFIEGKKGYMLANFNENYLHWNKKQQLQGEAVCLSGEKFGLVTLTEQARGDWAWLPKVHCKP